MVALADNPKLTEAELDELLALSVDELRELLEAIPDPQVREDVIEQLDWWVEATPKTEPARFRHDLVIDADGEEMRFTEALDPWQREDFEAMDPAWRRIIGLHDDECLDQAYFERPKGHSKSTDLAVMGCWAIYASRKKIRGVAAAESQEQAAELKDAIDTLIRLNPWLAEEIEVQQYIIKNKHTGSHFKILASNVHTSHGKNPDFIIVDELAHWTRRALWNAIYAAWGKRSKSVMIIITNAGEGRGVSWQWEVRESFRTDPKAYFRSLDGVQATWQSAERLARLTKGLPDNVIRRLYHNIWLTITGTGIDMEDVDACLRVHTCPACRSGDGDRCSGPGRCGPMLERDGHYAAYVAALDFGLTHDHAALVVLAINVATQKFRIAECLSWKPQEFPNGKISPARVQQETWSVLKKFRALGLVYDPWQFVGSAEWIESQYDQDLDYQCPTHEYEKDTHALSTMATTLIDVLRNHRLEGYEDKDLRTDFAKLSIVERPGKGVKLDGKSDKETGHCDRGIALTMLLPWAEATLADFLEDAA